MIHQVLGIGHWTVDFLFAVSKYDREGVLACLYDTGADEFILKKAEKLMIESPMNSGLTYSNPKTRRAVVLVGPTTKGDEFLDTISHEIRHLVDFIMSASGERLDGEPPAYLSGDTIRELAEVICTLGCDHCRANLSEGRYT